MALRKPLVVISGLSSQLPPGDTIEGAAVSSIATAGSGLSGGGPVGSDFRIDVALVSNPSGLYFSPGGSGLGFDGSAQASGNAALQKLADIGLGNLSGVSLNGYGAIAEGNVLTFSGGVFTDLPSAGGGTSFDDIFGIT